MSAKASEKGRPGSAIGRGSRVTTAAGWSTAKQTSKKNVLLTGKGGKEELYKEKCKVLKRRCGELEEQNSIFERKLKHCKRVVARLRLERSFLFGKLEQFEKVRQNVRSDSSSTSSSSDESESDSGSSEVETPARAAETPQTHKGSGRTKAEKDPLAPKRPANAFFMFCQHHRAQAQEEFADLRHPDITKILGQRWQQMTEQEKQPYYEMYEHNKTRYARDLKQYAKGELGGTATVTPTQPGPAKTPVAVDQGLPSSQDPDED